MAGGQAQVDDWKDVPSGASDDWKDIDTTSTQTQPAPAEPSTWEKLTRGYNPDVEQWAEKHPGIVGTGARVADAVGGALANIPSAIAHPIGVDPRATWNALKTVGQAAEDWMKPATWKAAPSVLPEALGQGIGTVAGGEMLGTAIPKISEMAPRNAAARLLRDPKTGQITVTPTSVLERIVPQRPEIAEAEHARNMESRIGEVEKARQKELVGMERLKEQDARARMARKEIPNISESSSSDMPMPLRPLIGSPEEWNAYDQQMEKILRPEASDAGTYHAARGSTTRKLNLQQRIGKKMIPNVR